MRELSLWPTEVAVVWPGEGAGRAAPDHFQVGEFAGPVQLEVRWVPLQPGAACFDCHSGGPYHASM